MAILVNLGGAILLSMAFCKRANTQQSFLENIWHCPESLEGTNERNKAW